MVKPFFWVMMQEQTGLWAVLGTYRRKGNAIRKANTFPNGARIVVRELQPYGPTVWESEPNTPAEGS